MANDPSLREVQISEHDGTESTKTKKVSVYGYDYDAATKRRISVNSDGIQEVISANALVPDEYDHIALTYVAAGNGAGEIETATFKTGGAGGTTVATLTLAYDGSDRLSSVTKA